MNSTGDEHKGYIIALLSAMILALTGICISYLSQEFGLDPLVLAFWRNGILVAVLFIILELSYPKLVEISKNDINILLLFGSILALFNLLWTWSVALNGAAVATFLIYSSVPFTALLGWLFLDEKPRLLMVGAILCSLAGCLLMSGTIGAAAADLSAAGAATGIGAGFCFAVYTIVGRRSRQNGLNTWTVMLYSFGLAACLLFVGEIVLYAATENGAGFTATFFSLGSSITGWGVLVFLAIGPTLLGFGLYNVSLGYLPSATVNLIATTEPPFTALIAYFLLGETLSFSQLTGAALILGAVLVLRLTPYINAPGTLQLKKIPGTC